MSKLSLALSKRIALFYRSVFFHSDQKRLKNQQDDASDLVIEKDISYQQKDNGYYRFDILSPKEMKQEIKNILVIHGGGLFYGEKELNRYSNMQLARKGYRVFALSYPLVPEVNYSVQIKACYSALEYITENYSLDEINLVGDSAGGMLSLALSSLVKDENLRRLFSLPEIKVKIPHLALISPMEKVVRTGFMSFLKPCTISKEEKKSERYPYLADVRKMMNEDNMTPAIIVTSDKDMLRKDVLSLVSYYRKKNVDYRLIDKNSQKRKLEHVFPIVYPWYPESQEVFSSIDTFFRLS